MAALPVIRGGFRVLTFDLETRPLSYWTPDRSTAEITGAAWAWADRPHDVECRLLGEVEPRDLLLAISGAIREADLVCGHYIRKFDLPQLQAALFEHGLPQLSAVLTQDTKGDLIKWGDLPKTQEFLAEAMGVPAPKVGMSQVKWRTANRLGALGLISTRERVVGDVVQHQQLRNALLNRSLLSSPRVWRP